MPSRTTFAESRQPIGFWQLCLVRTGQLRSEKVTNITPQSIYAWRRHRQGADGHRRRGPSDRASHRHCPQGVRGAGTPWLRPLGERNFLTRHAVAHDRYIIDSWELEFQGTLDD